MAKLYVLVGIPGSGKTHWEHLHMSPDVVRVNLTELQKEKLREKKGNCIGAYREAFEEFSRRINSELCMGRDVIAEAPHLTKASRDMTRAIAPSGTHCIAIHMDTPFATILQRNEERMQPIAEKELQKMEQLLESCPPSMAEGFDSVQRNTENGHGPVTDRNKEVEKMWCELEDVSFDEDEDRRLYLAEKWRQFPAGTDQEEIWHWFDENHSEGIAWLLYQFCS